MIAQLNLAVWTALPHEQQRRLIRYLGQLACRHLSAVHAGEGLAHDGDDSGYRVDPRQDPRPSSGSVSGGVRAPIDLATGQPPPGINPVTVWPGGPGAAVGLALGPDPGDRR